MNERLEEVLIQRMIPQPESVIFSDGVCVIANGVRVELYTAGSGAEAKVRARFRQFWSVEAEVCMSTAASCEELAPEGYRLDVAPERIAIAAQGIAGVEHALKTLRQLAEAGRGTATTQNYVLQACKIEDAPRLDFRGIHLCIFPETPMPFIDKQIRLAAYHKFNYAIIEAWGVFPFISRPEFGWAAHLRDIGRDMGISTYEESGHTQLQIAEQSVTPEW